MDRKFYTLQVHLIVSDPKQDRDVIEFKDLYTPDGKDFVTWNNELRDALFRRGTTRRTSPTTIEFISPFLIQTAFLIEQDKKHSP